MIRSEVAEMVMIKVAFTAWVLLTHVFFVRVLSHLPDDYHVSLLLTLEIPLYLVVLEEQNM